MLKMAKIERSIGIEVPGWYGPRPGGGFKGKTEELDQTVQQEAKILSEWLNCEIEIRFNSDRESGGAWIKDNHNSTQLGLNAGLRTVYPQGSYTKFLESKGLKDWFALYDLGEKDWSAKIAIEQEEKQLPKEIVINTYTEFKILKKGVVEKYLQEKGSDYLYLSFNSIAEAGTWLKENVDVSLITSLD
jgi:hypothetical protein